MLPLQGGQNSEQSWIPPSESPSHMQKMKLIGMMLSFCIRLAMSNHYYKFNGEIRRQSKRGGTGNSLRMELARMFCLWWDNQFVSMLEALKVAMQEYWRYVDDNGNILSSIDPGVRVMGLGPLTSPWMEALPFVPTSLWMEVKPKLIEVDTLRPADERTAAFLGEVADSIHPSIKVKADYPSKNLDQNMPLLD